MSIQSAGETPYVPVSGAGSGKAPEPSESAFREPQVSDLPTVPHRCPSNYSLTDKAKTLIEKQIKIVLASELPVDRGRLLGILARVFNTKPD